MAPEASALHCAAAAEPDVLVRPSLRAQAGAAAGPDVPVSLGVAAGLGAPELPVLARGGMAELERADGGLVAEAQAARGFQG